MMSRVDEIRERLEKEELDPANWLPRDLSYDDIAYLLAELARREAEFREGLNLKDATAGALDSMIYELRAKLAIREAQVECYEDDLASIAQECWSLATENSPMFGPSKIASEALAKGKAMLEKDLHAI